MTLVPRSRLVPIRSAAHARKDQWPSALPVTTKPACAGCGKRVTKNKQCARCKTFRVPEAGHGKIHKKDCQKPRSEEDPGEGAMRERESDAPAAQTVVAGEGGACSLPEVVRGALRASPRGDEAGRSCPQTPAGGLSTWSCWSCYQ